MATGAVRVKGLRELQRDFKKMSKEISKELREELKEAAEPVREAAEHLALGEIRNMPSSPDWAAMRTGVTARVVYVVPQQRGRGRRGRPNLANLLLERAMDPALEQNQDKVVDKIDDMLGRFGGDYGF